MIIDFPFRKERRNYVGKDQLQRMCRNEIERRVKEEADLVERKWDIFTGFFNLESKEHHFYRGKGRKKDEILVSPVFMCHFRGKREEWLLESSQSVR